MAVLREIGVEAGKALAVLALVFLAFVQHPAPVPQAGEWAALSGASSTLSYCGGAPADDGNGHGPCHACRSSAAALPDAPAVAVPAFAVCAAFATGRAPEAIEVASIRNPSPARAPPATA